VREPCARACVRARDFASAFALCATPAARIAGGAEKACSRNSHPTQGLELGAQVEDCSCFAWPKTAHAISSYQQYRGTPTYIPALVSEGCVTTLFLPSPLPVFNARALLPSSPCVRFASITFFTTGIPRFHLNESSATARFLLLLARSHRPSVSHVVETCSGASKGTSSERALKDAYTGPEFSRSAGAASILSRAQYELKHI